MADTDELIRELRDISSRLAVRLIGLLPTWDAHHADGSQVDRLLDKLEAAIEEKDREIQKGTEATANAWSIIHARDRTIARLAATIKKKDREIAELQQWKDDAHEVPGQWGVP